MLVPCERSTPEAVIVKEVDVLIRRRRGAEDGSGGSCCWRRSNRLLRFRIEEGLNLVIVEDDDARYVVATGLAGRGAREQPGQLVRFYVGVLRVDRQLAQNLAFHAVLLSEPACAQGVGWIDGCMCDVEERTARREGRVSMSVRIFACSYVIAIEHGMAWRDIASKDEGGNNARTHCAADIKARQATFEVVLRTLPGWFKQKCRLKKSHVETVLRSTRSNRRQRACSVSGCDKSSVDQRHAMVANDRRGVRTQQCFVAGSKRCVQQGKGQRTYLVVSSVE